MHRLNRFASLSAPLMLDLHSCENGRGMKEELLKHIQDIEEKRAVLDDFTV